MRLSTEVETLIMTGEVGGRWEEGGGHMERVGGDGDGRGMRKPAQEGEKSKV